MKAIKQIVKIPKSHEVKIKIPPNVPENETMEVILIFKEKSDSFEKKIEELKKAVKDKFFLEDIKTVSEDFKVADLEDWQ